ncbi:peptide ABC transporter permease [Oscillospiraceae bacterium]|nr:peptide ABC transporter permease [Oscillospiraceae bacterium]BDF73854.1 peptide ABC transporter permease [Oscillospiraceae bacterium]
MAIQNAASAPAESITFKKQGQAKEILRRLRKDKGAMVGLAILIVLLLVIVFADQIAPYEMSIKQDVFNKLQPPSAGHIMGTDTFGRDVLARLVHGARTSLTVALLASITSCIFGSLLGAVAGYFGGRVDMLIMRALDIFMSVPDLLFTMVVVAALGSSIPVLIVAMTLAYFTNYVRLVRSEVLNLCEQEYVEASRAGGAGPMRIILTHIIPNTMGIILVNLTLNVASLVIYQSTLSFIGLSLPQPMPEWGSMLSEARQYMLRAPYLMAFPAIAIVLTAFAVNLLGDGLRDAMDPRLKN